MSDTFTETANQPAPELSTRFVSSSTVDVGEGLKFEVTGFKVVPDRFAKEDDEDRRFGEITGDVLESRAHRFVDGQEIQVSCRSVALEALANKGPKPGDVITLVRGEDVGKVIGWRHTIERGA